MDTISPLPFRSKSHPDHTLYLPESIKGEASRVNMYSHTATKTGPPPSGGFALVIALGLMAFVVLLLLSLTTLIRVETRSAEVARVRQQAEQAALLGLNLALGELQKHAGPDQRVTARAELLGHSSNVYARGTVAAEGQGAWTGIWKSDTVAVGTPSYNPAAPNAKRFVGWLVSATDRNGQFQLPTALADVATNLATTTPTNGVANYVSLFNQSDGTPYAQVEKVRVDSGGSGEAYFAFHVEDESVKADLSWSETPASGSGSLARGRAQSRRLSAAPGPDFAALNGVDDNGPFGAVTYPLTIDSSAILDDILKIQNPADITTTMSAPATASNWLKDSRADVTWGSRGVLADVKRGGLRRDLSLAFEMDNEADVTASQQPTRFNQQVGEFVGGSDALAGQYDVPGMPVRERFLYRITQNDGSPFSADLERSDSVVRGPNWWALRDYYNLYKRIVGSAGNYTLQPRTYFPNNSAGSNVNYNSRFKYFNGLWDHETNNGQSSGYIFHPARATYAPVLLGTAAFYSVKQTGGNLTLVIDPLFYLWNPYNVTLDVPRYGLDLIRGFGGKVSFEVIKTDVDGNVTTTRYGPAKTSLYIQQAIGASDNLTYLVRDLTMAPGEVVIVSPGNATDPSATDYHDEATPGINWTSVSGIELTQMPRTEDSGDNSNWTFKQWETVALNPGDEVRCLLDVFEDYGSRNGGKLTNAWERFDIAAFLPNDSTIDAGSLTRADTDAERIQTIGGHLLNKSLGGFDENLLPDVDSIHDYPSSDWPSTPANIPGKFFFGASALLLKPANYSNSNGAMPNRNPVEVFSQFNPLRTGSFIEWNRACALNETFSALSEQFGSVNAIMQAVGIDPPFDAIGRNGYWGERYTFGGSTHVPFIDIPSAPLLSLADFSNANLSLRASEPYKKVGNSHASVFVPSNSLYGSPGVPDSDVTASDGSWLINDVLFDRYYLSGLAPEYSRSGNRYSTVGSFQAARTATLRDFFSADYQAAQANPVLRPYLPTGQSADTVVDALLETSLNNNAVPGYRKVGAYSLIEGAFNVNSTSVAAWAALLGANRDLAVEYAQGGSETSSGTPFPSGTSPVTTANGAATHWSGFSRLTNAQITQLATEIVNQVKARGPFMSLSDFVNRQLSDNDTLNAAGALQAALDETALMSSLKVSAGGIAPLDPADVAADGKPLFPGDADLSQRLSTEGIAGDIRQADLLRPLAPRLTARSDTFRIRSYGEVRSMDGSSIEGHAICEAVVQRLPEYVSAADNEPWDEITDAGGLHQVNQQFGRRFKIVQIRWIHPATL